MAKRKDTSWGVASIYAMGIIMLWVFSVIICQQWEFSKYASPTKQLTALKALVASQGYEMNITRLQNVSLAKYGYAQQIFKLTPATGNNRRVLGFMGNGYENPDLLVLRQTYAEDDIDVALWKITAESKDSNSYEELMDYTDLIRILKYADAIKKNKSLYREVTKVFGTPTPTTGKHL